MNDTLGPDARLLDLVGKLVARKLTDRAVFLAEARWPGSEPLIRLAADWPELTDPERAARLEQVGPDALVWLRSVAELQPELAVFLTELEARGAAAASSAAGPVEEPVAQKNPVVVPSAAVDEAGASATSALPASMMGEAAPPVDANVPPERPIAPILTVPMVDDRAVTEAEALLARVHARMQEVIDRAAEVGAPALSILPTAVPQYVAGGSDDKFRLEVLSRPVTERIARERLLELRRAAEEGGLEYVELVATELSRAELFGRLVRDGDAVVPAAGALPRAASQPTLIAFVGRLFPRLVERLREGYCDIPGTNATVRVHPRCRVVVVDR